jgi:hypothetical protein
MTFKLEEWSDERLRRLAELWPDPTWSVRAVARELGVSITAAQRQAKQLGLQGRPRNTGEPWHNQWPTR